MTANSLKDGIENPARFKKWLWIGLSFFLFLAVLLFFLWKRPEPSYGGKQISEWFEDAVNENGASLSASPSMRAFEQMEGDAIPFLIRQIHNQSATNNNGHIIVALELLGSIGDMQRRKTEVGEPSAKPSIALAIPDIKAVLKSPIESTRKFAAQAAWFIGPPAAATIPDLIKLVSDSQDGTAIQSLGMMGVLASNAVPDLIDIVRDDSSRERRLAIVSLGEIGEPAHSAAPVLTSLLANTNETLRVAATRSLAEIGFTPDEAVPTLTVMKQGTNDWLADLATLALWNRDHQDSKLQAELVTIFHTDKRGWLLSSLAGLGTNAAPLVPEIKLLVNDPDPNISHFAKRALRRIQPTDP